ncbi:MAG: ROK family protein [Planctomycetes bacterium]|nr:ROK family protein [Planctomycetota bacterium]
MASKEQHLQGFVSILRFRGSASRLDLAAALGLAPSAISSLMKPLADRGVITSQGTTVSGGGRRVSMLALNPGFLPALGVEVSGRGIRSVVTDTLGAVVSRRDLVECPRDPDKLASIIRGIIAEERTSSGIAAAGIALGGPVDAAGRLWRDSGRWGHGKDIALADVIAAGPPVLLTNDVHAAGLAESRVGAARDYGVVLYVHAGTGVRISIALDKRVYTGAHGVAGELGHTRSADPAKLCYCGNYGCIETIASIPAALEQISAARGRAAGTGASSLTVDDLVRLAGEGDKLAVNTLTRAAEEIGRSAGDAATLFDPDAVVVGGRLVEEVGVFAGTLRRVLRSRLLPIIRGDVQIFTGSLGRDAAGIGAAMLAQDAEFVRLGLLSGEAVSPVSRSGNASF